MWATAGGVDLCVATSWNTSLFFRSIGPTDQTYAVVSEKKNCSYCSSLKVENALLEQLQCLLLAIVLFLLYLYKFK